MERFLENKVGVRVLIRNDNRPLIAELSYKGKAIRI